MDTPLSASSYLKSIHHSGSSRYVHHDEPHLGDIVTIRLRTSVEAPIHQVLLRSCPDGEQVWVARNVSTGEPKPGA